MAPRANWKGVLKVGELTCPVALYTAASSSDRIAFHTLNRETGHRVRRQFVDPETGEPVESGDQVKGYEVSPDNYIMLEPEDVAAVIPESDKVLDIAAFIRCGDIDDLYFDRPYYLAPSDATAGEAFALIRDGMQSRNVAALARAVLFRRVRTLLVRAHDDGLIATTLNFDYEIRSAREAFDAIPARKIEGEMLELASHIITTKTGRFDPATFEDRYETALADLVKAKVEGKPFAPRKSEQPGNVVSLLDALRKSAGAATARGKKAAGSAKGKSSKATRTSTAKKAAKAKTTAKAKQATSKRKTGRAA